MNERINPFREVIVTDARQPEPVVAGLNEQAFRILRQRFATLTQGEAPRVLRRAEQALLVFSEEPGYGKSHLISRLFRELHGKASLVYVYPFQNPRAPFQSLMLALTREIHFPDREATGAWDRDLPSQLDHLAHAVLAHVLADLIDGVVNSFQITAPEGAAAALRRQPLKSFERGTSEWGKWLQTQWPTIEKVFEPALAHRGLRLHQPTAWMRVLRAYAFSPFDPVARRICTDWMCGQPFDPEEATRIGLPASDAINGEIAPDQGNDLCRERLHDLCELACYFRPFVFCFDQTEVYCGSPALAHAFGTVVATLVNEARGHVTMVTANQRPWTDRLRPHMEDADFARFDQPPVYLEGLNRAQAEELVQLRVKDFSLEASEAKRFLAGVWFRELFPGEKARMGARAFLQICKERWSGAEEAPDLAALFNERRDKILASPKRHVFEPDTLQWLVEVAAQGLPDMKVSSIDEKYAVVQWETAERPIKFGFLPTSQWRQWLTVARIAEAGGPGKYVYFRVPGQPPIPAKSWYSRDEIHEAKKSTLHLVVLTLEEMADLYAPRDLFAEAAQGDIPFPPEEVISYVQKRLAPYWTRLKAAIGVPVVDEAPTEAAAAQVDDIPQPGPLAAEVRAIVERARFLSIEELQAELNRPNVTREAVLAAVGFCAEIRLHVHPKMTVLQWQGKG